MPLEKWKAGRWAGTAGAVSEPGGLAFTTSRLFLTFLGWGVGRDLECGEVTGRFAVREVAVDAVQRASRALPHRQKPRRPRDPPTAGPPLRRHADQRLLQRLQHDPLQ